MTATEWVTVRILIRSGCLDEKERELIELRYFQDKTQMEVAKRLRISQVQVSRMEKRILLRMREKGKV